MKIPCGACGAGNEETSNFCITCGTSVRTAHLTTDNFGAIISAAYSQMMWHKNNLMRDPISIPPSGTSSTVDRLQELKLTEMGDHLARKIETRAVGVDSVFGINSVVDCKPLGPGFITVLDVKMGDARMHLPIYTDDENLTSKLAELFSLIISVSVGGLTKGNDRLIPMSMESDH
jgi:hypothetical protein